MTTERTHASASKGGSKVGETAGRNKFQEEVWRGIEDLMGLLPLVIPAWDTKGSVLLRRSKLSHTKLWANEGNRRQDSRSQSAKHCRFSSWECQISSWTRCRRTRTRGPLLSGFFLSHPKFSANKIACADACIVSYVGILLLIIYKYCLIIHHALT